MLKNIEAGQAADMLCALDVRYETESAGLFGALGRVLAQDIAAQLPTPPFDKSPYDGYALRGDDTASASEAHPVTLTITEEIPAGTAPSIAVKPGYAAKILTGAPIPEGADATIKYETVGFTKTEIRITEPIKPGSNIVRAGDDVKKGAVLARAGSVVTAPMMGVLAGQGLAELTVYKKPVVALLNTGSELVEVGEPLRPAAIYNSNAYMLGGYLTEMGTAPYSVGLVEDDPDKIAELIDKALVTADMVITTGGASVGDYDWAVTSAERVGARVLFWKADIKPGGSLMAAVKDGKVILGLSGNPGAAVLGLMRIALPYIRKLCGRSDAVPPLVDVYLKKPFRKASPKLRLVRGHLEIIDGKAYFAENEGQSNGAVLSLVGCDLLAELPAGSPPLPAGEKVRAYRL